MTCILGKIKDGVYCRDDKGGCVLYLRYRMKCILGKIMAGVYCKKDKGWKLL